MSQKKLWHFWNQDFNVKRVVTVFWNSMPLKKLKLKLFNWLLGSLKQACNYGEKWVGRERKIHNDNVFEILELLGFQSKKKKSTVCESNSQSGPKNFGIGPRSIKQSQGLWRFVRWNLKKLSKLIAVLWHIRVIKSPKQRTKPVTFISNFPLRKKNIHWLCCCKKSSG